MKTLLICSVIALATSCSCQKDGQTGSGTADKATSSEDQPTMAETGPAVLVYSTTTDHNDHVPVMLSDDGKAIVSYPDPTDLRSSDGLPKPTDLGKGYRLDNRGIGTNVAFLSMGYAEYAALEKAPSTAELMAMILDRDPLKELYHCGPRTKYTDVVAELKKIIAADALGSRCKKLK